MITEKYIDDSLNYTINIVNSQIESVRTQKIKQQSIRLFHDDGRLGISSGIGEVDEAYLIQKALENSNLGFTYQYDLEKNVHYHVTRGDHDLVNMDLILGLTDELLTELKKLSKRYIFSNQVKAERHKLTIQSSTELYLSRDVSEYNAGIILKKIGSPDIMNGFLGFESYFRIDKEAFLQECDIIMQATDSQEINLDHEEMPVAYLNMLPLNKLNSDINGESYHLGSSLLTGKLGEKIMHESVNISEVHDNQDLCIFSPFDHEGIIRNHDLAIVKNGILTNIVYDKKTAYKYDTKTTGNGFRNAQSHPSIGIRQLLPEISTGSLIECSKSETVLLVAISGGGDFLPNGDFSFPVQLAYYLKDGKIIGKAPQLTVTGNYLKTMNEDLIGIAENDLLRYNFGQPVIIARNKISVN